MDELVKLAAAADDIPTLAQVDEMLAVLGSKPKSQANSNLMDMLFDLRAGVQAA